MFLKCGSLEDACQVFERIQRPDVVSWTTLIVGYSENREPEVVLELFQRMQLQLVAVVKACMALGAIGQKIDGKVVKAQSLEKGMAIHAMAVSQFYYDSDVFLASSLVEMYARCGSLLDACKVFDRIVSHDSVLWTALVLGYADNGEEEIALELFRCMSSRGCTPDCRTYVAEEARRVFLGGAASQNLVSWTSLVLGYARNGKEDLALEAFTGLRPQGCVPKTRPIVAALKACIDLAEKEDGTQVEGNFVKLAALEKGMAVHSEAAAKCPGDLENTFVASSLIDFYVKCGSMGDARRVFDTMPDPGLVLWSTLMLGYADDGEGDIALELYKLVNKSYTPDTQTLAAALTAFARVVSLQAGKEIHSEIYRCGLEGDATCMVDFYGWLGWRCLGLVTSGGT
ncbi:pentatricopeptide repeat-containing protein At2g13600-like [Selaginella moellendorffii]|uniref:pentatricopeptide repeat-containing protein At2g13600-like n=1 Tax=Selaginella moellendorffii TaxID=88036 RepID=UPI000D1C815C|nr:pentatricopeptide repeat-containing protein At2g13600-like [Selaginella moellendorffii]|eukprot:XP_024537299.1 pentatricopeptide repeat-containing protein At2g13600-like [Selaginella moellendorffii]